MPHFAANQSNAKALDAASTPTGWQLPGFDDSAWIAAPIPTPPFMLAEVMQNGINLVGSGSVVTVVDCQPVGESLALFSGISIILFRWTFTLTTVPTVEPMWSLFWPVTTGLGIAVPFVVYVNGVQQLIPMNAINWLGHYHDLVVGRNVIAASIVQDWDGGMRWMSMAIDWPEIVLSGRTYAQIVG